MSFKNKLELHTITIISHLKDAVNEYVAEPYNGTVTNVILRTPTGLAFKLDDLENWTVTSGNYSGVKISIGGLNFNVNGQTAVDAFGNLHPLSIIFGFIEDIPYPKSNNWYFVRDEGYKKGVNHTPVEYYTLGDSMIDGTVMSFILGLAYAIIKSGLYVLGRLFLKRALTNNTIGDGDNQIDTVIDMLDEMQDDVDVIKDETTNDATEGKLKNYAKAAKSICDTLKDEIYEPGMSHDLRAKIVWLRNYIEAIHAYILNPAEFPRPNVNLDSYWSEV